MGCRERRIDMKTRKSNRSDPSFSLSADGPASAEPAPFPKLHYDSEGRYLDVIEDEREDA